MIYHYIFFCLLISFICYNSFVLIIKEDIKPLQKLIRFLLPIYLQIITLKLLVIFVEILLKQ